MFFLTEEGRNALTQIRRYGKYDLTLDILSPSEKTYLKSEICIRSGNYVDVDNVVSEEKNEVIKQICLAYRNIFTNTQECQNNLNYLFKKVDDPETLRRLSNWQANLYILAGKIKESSALYSNNALLTEKNMWRMEEYSLLALYFYISGDNSKAVRFHELAHRLNEENPDRFLSTFNSAMAIRLAVKIGDASFYDKYILELEKSSEEEFKRFKLRQFGLRAIILLQNGDFLYAKNYWDLAEKYLPVTQSPFEAGQYLILRAIGEAVIGNEYVEFFDRAKDVFSDVSGSLSYLVEIDIGRLFGKIANIKKRSLSLKKQVEIIESIYGEITGISLEYPDYLSYYFDDAKKFCKYLLGELDDINYKPSYSLILSVLFNCNMLEEFEFSVSRFRIVPTFVNELNTNEFNEKELVSSLEKNLKTKVVLNKDGTLSLGDETTLLIPEFKDIWNLGNYLYKLNQDLKLQYANLVSVSLSKQLAHDIRSPLAALDMSIKSLDKVEPAQRQLIRSAINRIHDIANNLVGKTMKLEVSTTQESTLLSSVLFSIVSEKRTEFRNLNNVDIDFSFGSKSYGLFSNINTNELKRVLSNLINNSVEAIINKSGFIEVKLTTNKEFNQIIVTDDGKGISKEDIEYIFDEGTSIDKKDGTGLGLFHAKNKIEEWGGSIKCQSTEGLGTIFTITLPRSNPPSNFVENISFGDANIIVVDDDSSIHQLWKGRFESAGISKERITYFSSPKLFKSWYEVNPNTESFYLFDYEYLGHDTNGLDLASIVDSKNIYIVTSRYEEGHIKSTCKKEGYSLVDKGMIGFVPLFSSQNTSSVKEVIVLIDDDELIHMSWKMEADKSDRKLDCYFSIDEFISNKDNYNTNTTIYIDSNLGDGVKGEVESEKIYELGYKNLFIATGFSPEDIDKPDWIVGIVGKRADFK